MSDLSRRPLVIYHGSCPDGFTAAWAFRKFMGEDVEWHPTNYGDDPPDVKGRKVWILDFSFPREVMMDVIVSSKRTVVYDHHKTAEEDLGNILQAIRIERNVLRKDDKIVFDMHRSGAGITYDELEREANAKKGFREPRFNGQRADHFVDYIEDRDLWKFQYPNSENVSAYVMTLEHSFEEWDRLSKMSIDEMATRGADIQRYIDEFGRRARAHMRFENLGQYRVPTVNLPYMNCSEHVGKLAEEHPEAPFAVGYFRRADGSWQFSLRTRNKDFDVSEVARIYGGGGHKAAAGFEAPEPPWSGDPYVDPASRGRVETISIGDNVAEVEDHEPPDEAVDFNDI